jgi:hypothetical protein
VRHPGNADLRFDRNLVPGLPPLAWLFQSRPDRPGLLWHGSGVWVHADGFLEGCQPAEGPAGSRSMSQIFGSALDAKGGDAWCFVTPSHTLEALYIYQHAGGAGVSNSLPFLTAFYGLAPPWDPRYGARFASLCLGMDDLERTLWSTPDGAVSRVVHHNIEMDRAGDYRLVRKPLPPEFQSFEGYRAYLRATLEAAFANAADPARAARYRPLATCSTGYDSAAAAALGAPLGCHEVVTVRTARNGQVDSGRPVAEALGLRVTEVERPARVEGGFEEAAEFLATGMGGEDYCLKGLAPHVGGRVVLSGFGGGNTWEPHVEPSAALAKTDLSGTSLQEFRLWKNFMTIPVPMIGAVRHAEISAIAKESEMDRYRLGTRYDRPIARRIVEEAGVPRSFFGHQKRAASVLVFQDSRLLSGTVRRERDAQVPTSWVWRARYSPRRVGWELRFHLHQRLQPHRRKSVLIRRLQRAIVGDWRVFEHGSPLAALAFVSGVRVMARRYETALDGRRSTAAV